MVRDSIVLRAADQTFDEGLACARYLDQAAEGFFRFWLGPRVEEIIATAFLKPDHDLSYQNVTFAELDNTIVGMVCVFTAEQHHRSSREPVYQAAGGRNLRMRVIDVLFAPMMRVVNSIPKGDFYLQSIAVDKELQGHGVGSILMGFVEERARKSGSNRLSLDVSARNHSACLFYERRGMSVESQWPKRFSIPGLTFFRMIKRI